MTAELFCDTLCAESISQADIPRCLQDLCQRCFKDIAEVDPAAGIKTAGDNCSAAQNGQLINTAVTSAVYGFIIGKRIRPGKESFIGNLDIRQQFVTVFPVCFRKWIVSAK